MEKFHLLLSMRSWLLAIGQAFLFTVLPKGFSFRPLGEVVSARFGISEVRKQTRKNHSQIL
jgi:hypothetical protein